MRKCFYYKGEISILCIEPSGYWAMIRRHAQDPKVCKVKDVALVEEESGGYFFKEHFHPDMLKQETILSE